MSARRVAVFPGQFDPITNGHIDIIRRGAALFDELVVAVGINPEKRELFTLEERFALISELVKEIPNARAAKFEGLTVDFVRSVGAAAILRGIRDVSDVHYEFQLALANRAVGGVETVFIMTGDNFALTSSSLIRQVVMLGADLSKLVSLVPANVLEAIRKKRLRGQAMGASVPDAPAT